MAEPTTYGNSDVDNQFKVKYDDAVPDSNRSWTKTFYVKSTVKTDENNKKYTITTLYEDTWGIGPHTEVGTLDSRTNLYTNVNGSDSQYKHFSGIDGKNTIRAYSQRAIYNGRLDAGDTEDAAELYAYESIDRNVETIDAETGDITWTDDYVWDSDKDGDWPPEEKKDRKASTFNVTGVSKPVQGTLWGEKAFSSRSKTLVYPEDHASEEFDFIKITPIEYVPALTDSSFTDRGTVGGGHYNINLNDDDWFGFKNVSQRYLRVKQVGSTMFLPMTPDISENNGVDWGGDRLNPIQAAMGRVAFDAIGEFANTKNFKDVGAAVQNVGEDIANVTKGFMRAPGIEGFMKAYFAGKAVNANLLKRAGIVVNPNLEVLFNGPQLRSFQYNFRFTPRTPSEATTIRTIIKVFKKTMAPKRRDKIFLSVPAVYKIKYIFNGDTDDNHPFLNKIKPCALSGFNVQYAPDGSYMTYDNGSMTSYNVSMKFDELEPIFNDDIKNVDDATTGF